MLMYWPKCTNFPGVAHSPAVGSALRPAAMNSQVSRALRPTNEATRSDLEAERTWLVFVEILSRLGGGRKRLQQGDNHLEG